MSTKDKTLEKSTGREKEESAPKSAPEEKKKAGTRRRGPPNKAPPKAEGDDPFAPRFVTAPGPVVNDPLGEKFFFPLPGDQLTQTSGTRYIYPGCEGLVPLASEEYTALVAHTFSVKRSISQSGYCYYAACLTWARLLEVESRNGRGLTRDEKNFVEKMRDYKPPKVLGTYIAGIGDTGYPSSFNIYAARIISPTYHQGTSKPYLPGWFGKLKDNARYYASYPCIAVFAARILADIRATSLNEDDFEWDLPLEFQYPDHPPTTSLIGYQVAQPLDRAIIHTYQLCQVTRNHFEYENDSLAVNYSLLNEIQLWVEEVRCLVQIPFPLRTDGSRGQLILSRVVGARNSLKTSDWRAESALRLPPNVEFAGSTFTYRIDKCPPTEDSDWKVYTLYCPFTVTANLQVPQDLNFLRTQEDDPLLFAICGRSPSYVIGERLRLFMSANLSQRTNPDKY